MQLDPDADVPQACADLGLLDRALANVVENALRHADGKDIRVTAGKVGDRVQVRVVDRGPGVPDADKEKIFAAFQRAGDRPHGEGLGLGLAVARGLMTVMDGSLTPEDTPGGGLTMVLELPIASPTGSAGPETPARPQAASVSPAGPMNRTAT